MAPRGRVNVRAGVLHWARHEAGLTQDEAAERLRIPTDRLRQFESGERAPSLTQLRRIASVYRTSLVTLAMPNALAPTPLPEDMRTVPGVERPLSPVTRQVIRLVGERQRFASVLVEEAPDLFARFPVTRARLTDDAQRVATTERQRLKVSVDAQMDWEDVSEAFRTWRSAVESQGILVFVERMPREDCRGFCLWSDEFVPAIVINSAEKSIQPRIFSLFHEYAHILLHQSATCLELEDVGERTQMERFCNRFSAHLLMPAEAVERAMGLGPLSGIPPRDWPLAELQTYARRLKVSRPALALRFQTLGIAPADYYERVEVQLEEEAGKQRPEGPGGPRYHIRMAYRLGPG